MLPVISGLIQSCISRVTHRSPLCENMLTYSSLYSLMLY